MKLRNKKTGETWFLEHIAILDEPVIYANGRPFREYTTLAELNKEWEDAPEPLIKDEKIRKAVRAWWECCQEGSEDKRIYIKDAEFRMGVYRLDLGRYYLFDDKKEGFYTIAELCGEEE